MRWLHIFLAGALGVTLFWPRNPGLETPPQEVCAFVWQVRKVAWQYQAPTPEEASALAAQLIPAQQPDGSTLCGPLTASMLADLHLLSRKEVHRFWLLDPERRPRFLRQAFLSSVFTRYDFRQPVGHFAFLRFPLIPGDVVYLYAGLRYHGFEHMLMVSHVDRWGRAFSVTNVYTPQGYVVREVLLYDPEHPDTGYFSWWNDPMKKAFTGGVTGTNGFTVWRQKWLEPYAAALARGACTPLPLGPQWTFPVGKALWSGK